MSDITLLSADAFDLQGRNWAENEQHLMDICIRNQSRIALVCRGRDGIVVPRSYRGKPGFHRACAELEAEGLPVHIRLTGGGVVPQSADTVNLYLAYTVNGGQPLQDSEYHYVQLCALLQNLFALFGIRTDCQTVGGSFCDGRFNLAADGRKIAGTSQCWQRRRDMSDSHTVLLSAVILAANPQLLTDRANRLEAALGSPTRYRPEKTAAVAEYAAVDAEEVVGTLCSLLRNMPLASHGR